MPRTRRFFSPELKAQIVLQLLTGAANQAELCRKHNIKPQLIANWKAAILERLPPLFDDDARHDLDQDRNAELEQLVGRQAYEVEALKKASHLLTGPATRNGRSS